MDPNPQDMTNDELVDEMVAAAWGMAEINAHLHPIRYRLAMERIWRVEDEIRKRLGATVRDYLQG